MTSLTKLALQNNNISNVTSLAGLVNLTWLRLAGNPINDLSSLVTLVNVTDSDVDLPEPDTTAPGVSISVPSDVQNSAFNATITFTEAVSDFVQADVGISGTAAATITAWNTNSGNTVYTATITPTTSGTVTVSVAANVATDAANNQNTATTSQTVSVDVDRPTTTISVPSGTQTGAFDTTITFSETVSGFVGSDVSLTGSAASITLWSANSDNTVYTATITPTASGTVTVSVAADVATDAVGNQNSAATSQTVTVSVDTAPPGVSITVPSGAQNGAFNVTITFTEAVSDFVQSELSLTGTASASVTAWNTTDNTTYTTTITPTTSGTVTLGIAAGVATDAANNPNTVATSQTVSVDVEPPGVSISVPSGVQNGSFSVTVAFTEDISVVRFPVLELVTNTAGATINSGYTMGSNKTGDYVIHQITPTRSGEVTLHVPAGVVADLANNPNTVSNTQTIRVDVDRPGVSLSVPSGTQTGAFDATITFSETVSGFVGSEVSLSGSAASITSWSANSDDTVYTATITPTASGTVTVSVAANVATDAANNPNTAATSQTVTVSVDVDAPGVSISVPSGDQTNAFEATITFTEAVSDFEQGDLSISGTANATSTAWNTTDNITYTATITPTTTGTVTLNVAAGVATDAADNLNTASETHTVTAFVIQQQIVDTTSPSVSITVPTEPQNHVFEATITFTEAVSGFVQSELSLTPNTAGATITGWVVSSDNTTYTATITPTTSGEVVLSIAAGVAIDAANNPNTASQTQTVSVDMDAPGVRISVSLSVQTGAFAATIIFTETVLGFIQSDLSLTGSTASATITAWNTTDNTTYTATITPTTNGIVSISVPVGVATDAASNPNFASVTYRVPVLVAPPERVITPVCNRTTQVRDAIVAAVPGVSDCNNVTYVHLTGIRGLNLKGQNITTLKTGDLDGLIALDQLLLNFNDLSSLPADVFDELTALKALSLLHNDLSSLPAGVFDELTALESLYLSDNDLSSLPAGVFDKLTALEQLGLSGNDLSSLPAGVFDKLIALQVLYLSSNDLSSLPAGVFDELTALEQLGLSENDLSSLPAGIFDELAALKSLRLFDNDLSSLPAGVFDELTALELLSLSNNDLSSLPAGVFDELAALETLWLRVNQLSALPAGIFDKLTALEKLHLSGNPVDPLPLTVSLAQAGEAQFKATAPTGAPFDVVLPLSVTNGSIDNRETTTITIPIGSVESEPFTVTRTPDTTDAVTVEIGTLPGIPSNHSGYTLVKSTDLPLEVLAAVNMAPSLAAVEKPDETALLENYPNPFNPETWIPYQLASDTDVQLSIYDINGALVRQLDLGHQRAGYYTNRSRAAYWDGRNEFGERVATGIYFYQLRAGSESFLRKMVILK